MDRSVAIQAMQSKKPQTSSRLLRAIKALGDSREEIVQTLVTLGFQEYNQTKVRACPVCAYLLSLGFKSPYVDISGVRLGQHQYLTDSNSVGINFEENGLDGMIEMQMDAASGLIPEFNSGASEVKTDLLWCDEDGEQRSALVITRVVFLSHYSLHKTLCGM